VGIGDVTPALSDDIRHLNRAISIALNRQLNARTVDTLIYLQEVAVTWLKDRGYRYLSIPPDSDRRNNSFVSKLYGLFCHKTAATCAGLGWIGKNGLVINERYGSKLSWATVLTDAPFEPDEPIQESRCGDCDLCVRYCPSGALVGSNWTVKEPFKPIVRYDSCRSLKRDLKDFREKPNCGLCVNICPYSRMDNADREEGETFQCCTMAL